MLSLAAVTHTASGSPGTLADPALHWAAPLTLALFVVAYLIVMGEEKLHIRKSLPVMIAAGAVWILVAVGFGSVGRGAEVGPLLRHHILDFAELFLFLLAAMTFVNTMEERGVFEALRNWLIGRGMSLRMLFWVTGGLAFFISPVADNLTTALVMGAVAMAVGAGKPKFIALACINIVVAANAGGAFSPFGDITTLMVWQKGKLTFFEFFPLFIPSLVNWLVPAALMSMAVEKGMPVVKGERVFMKAGALTVVFLLIGTIAFSVTLHNVFHLPPVLGMMTGLGVLNLFAFWLKRRLAVVAGPPEFAGTVIAGTVPISGPDGPETDEMFAVPFSGRPAPDDDGGTSREAAEPAIAQVPEPAIAQVPEPATAYAGAASAPPAIQFPGRFKVVPARVRRAEPLDVLRTMERTEWDTLMFFYGIVLCVGALGAFGYLAGLSQWLYGDLGATWANVLVGLLSAIIDNIPIMFAVLAMDPAMPDGQWLLVTLTAGVGGSLLSIGSAAGVALMGQARGAYTFLSHLKWTWAVALGYAASIGVHMLLNQAMF